MRPTHPPRLAAFLLNLFAVNEPLAGDLHEEYLAGRSATWYWRQVLAAVLLGPTRRVEIHELFAVQNMFMQCVMLALVSVCVVFTVKFIAVVMFDESVRQMLIGPRGARELLRFILSFSVAIPIGVAIARVHARSRRAAVLAFSTTVPLWAFVNVYLLNGHGNLDSALPHVIASLVFIAGLLSGGIHVDALTQSRQVKHS
jgi:hypothetical protein